eukprot:1000859-Rhodomonas_salina.1
MLPQAAEVGDSASDDTQVAGRDLSQWYAFGIASSLVWLSMKRLLESGRLALEPSASVNAQ